MIRAGVVMIRLVIIIPYKNIYIKWTYLSGFAAYGKEYEQNAL